MRIQWQLRSPAVLFPKSDNIQQSYFNNSLQLAEEKELFAVSIFHHLFVLIQILLKTKLTNVSGSFPMPFAPRLGISCTGTAKSKLHSIEIEKGISNECC